jgi:hypothetical protein
MNPIPDDFVRIRSVKLSKSVLQGLPDHVWLLSGVLGGVSEMIASVSDRESQWARIKDAGCNGRNFFIFQHKSGPEPGIPFVWAGPRKPRKPPGTAIAICLSFKDTGLADNAQYFATLVLDILSNEKFSGNCQVLSDQKTVVFALVEGNNKLFSLGFMIEKMKCITPLKLDLRGPYPFNELVTLATARASSLSDRGTAHFFEGKPSWIIHDAKSVVSNLRKRAVL